MLKDGGSCLNILYVDMLEAMGIPCANLRTTLFPFYGIIPGMMAYPLGDIDLPVTFDDRDNFRVETLIFEVADWEGAYHTIVGRPGWRSPTTPT